jgi:hypothetical protein
VTGLSDEAEMILKSLGALDDLPAGHLISDRLAAIKRAVEIAA